LLLLLLLVKKYTNNNNTITNNYIVSYFVLVCVCVRGLCTILRGAAGGQDCVQDFDNDDYKNNSHWLSDGENSNYVGYYDAASLYPSSGEFKLGISVRPARAGLLFPLLTFKSGPSGAGAGRQAGGRPRRGRP
jgi:hypothetical protein